MTKFRFFPDFRLRFIDFKMSCTSSSVHHLLLLLLLLLIHTTASIDDASSSSDAAAECHLAIHSVAMDVVFLVDGSYSIEPREFKRGLEFVTTFVDFVVGYGGRLADNGTRIGVIQFSDLVQVEIGLDEQEPEIFMKHKIETIPQMELGTYTGKGLKVMDDHFRDNERPDDYLKLGFVLTDGVSQDGIDVVRANADRLRHANVSLFAIGVGNDTRMEELEVIAGGKGGLAAAKSRVFSVDNYAQLSALATDFRRRVCADVVIGWRRFFADLVASPKFYVPVGVIVFAGVVGALVFGLVVWRLGVLARRRISLGMLKAAEEGMDENSELNRIYKAPERGVEEV